jgi:hypothetical protein
MHRVAVVERSYGEMGRGYKPLLQAGAGRDEPASEGEEEGAEDE